jgi:hypothetical protein
MRGILIQRLPAAVLCGVLGFLSPKAEASSSEIYRLKVSLTTTSDWTSVDFKDVPMGAFVSRIEEGSNASNLWIDKGPVLGIAKNSYDQTKVVIDFEVYIDLEGYQQTSLTLGISKGWLNSTNVVLFNQNSTSAVLIESYTHEGSVDPNDPANRKEFIVPLDKITGGGPLPSRSHDKTILSFYYPWFGTPWGPTGYWHQWIPSLPRYGSAHTPYYGFYDSLDETTIRRHIQEAHEAGIDGLVVSWWGRDSFEDRAFKKILPIAEEAFFPVTIYYEAADNISQVADDIQYLVQQYGQSPSFLKEGDVPVIFIYGRVILKFGKEEWESLFQSLDQKSIRCFLVADGLWNYYLGDDSLEFLFELFQGVHAYIPISLDETSIRDMNVVNSIRAKGRDMLFAATVVPGFDNTPTHDPGFMRERQDGAYYRQGWDAAMAGKPDWILVTTFNEWHEGTEIEPSIESGNQYLKLTLELGNVWNPVKKLRIMTQAGGTTDPEPGTYSFDLGHEATVTAVPDLYYDLKSWSGDAAGKTNPITMTLNMNKLLIANFIKINAPLNFAGRRELNRSLSQAEYIHVLTWDANPANEDIANYRIYLVEEGQKTLLATLGSDDFIYRHRKTDKNKAYTYWIVAVGSSSNEGEPAVVTIQ